MGDLMKVNFEEKMIKKYRVETGVEFYLIYEREREQYHVYVIRDPQYDNQSSFIWRRDLAQIIRDSTGIKNENIIVTASTSLVEPKNIVTEERIFELFNCQKCGALTPKNAKYCIQCGDLVP